MCLLELLRDRQLHAHVMYGILLQRPAEMYGDHTIYQDRSLKLLRLVPLEYMGTSPDGNCLFNDTSQCTSDLSHEEMSQHPFRTQHLQAELRQKAAGLLQTDPWLEKHMSGLQDNAFPGYSNLCSEHCLRPEVPVSQLLASAIINDKAWAGTWCAKALAIVVQHNLVVISTHGLVLYTNSNDPDSRMKCVECCYIVHAVRIPGGMTEEETCFLKSYMLIHKTSDGSVTNGQHCDRQRHKGRVAGQW